MKVDKEFLLKNRFWVLLGVFPILFLIAFLILATAVAGMISSERQKVLSKLKSVKGRKQVKSGKWEVVEKERAKKHEKLKEVVWMNAYKEQGGNFAWPAEFEKEYEFENGLFILSLNATRKKGAKLEAPPALQGKAKVKSKEVAEYKIWGRILDPATNWLKIEVKGGWFEVVNKDTGIESVEKRSLADALKMENPPSWIKKRGDGSPINVYRFRRTGATKVTITDDAGEKKEFSASDSGDVVTELKFQVGKYFGDKMTYDEIFQYQLKYRQQIEDIIKLVQPLQPNGEGIVQFRGWTYDRKRDPLPPGNASFFHYVADPWKLDRNNLIENSNEAWVAQEDLWIQGELFRLIRETNDYVAKLRCEAWFHPKKRDAGSKNDWFAFTFEHWKLELRLSKDNKLEARLTNEGVRPETVKELVYWIKVNPVDPPKKTKTAPKNGPGASTGAPPMGGAPVNGQPQKSKVKKALAGNMVAIKLKHDGELAPNKPVTLPVTIVTQSKKKWLGLYQVQEFVETAAQGKKVIDYEFAGGGSDNYYVYSNPHLKLQLKLHPNKTIEVARITNRSSSPQRVDITFKLQVTRDPRQAPEKQTASFRLTHGPIPPRKTIVPKNSRYKLKLSKAIKAPKGIFGVQQVLTWDYAAVKRIDEISIGSGKSPSQGGGGDAGDGGRAGGPEGGPAGAGAGGGGAAAGGGGGAGAAKTGVAHSHRTFPKGLKAFPGFKTVKADGAAGGNNAGENDAGGGAPAGAGGGVQGAGDKGGKNDAAPTMNGFDVSRYVDISKQARRVPVGIVLIVDQEQVGRVLAAFTNSKMRFLTTQVLLNRYPSSIRPLSEVDKSGKKGDGKSPPAGGGPAPGTGGGAPAPGAGGGAPAPGAGGGGSEDGGLSSGGGTTIGDDRVTNVELVIYGFVTLYQRYPTRPGDTSLGQ